MMKNKIFRSVTNGMLLAALAAIGIAAFQLGTSSPEESKVPEEIRMSEELPAEDTEDTTLDVGNSNVTAEIEAAEPEEESEETVDTNVETDEESNADVEKAADFTEEAEETSAGITKSLADIHFSEDTVTEWPVTGTILLDYNMDQTMYFPTLDQYKLNPSISVQAMEGDPVRAVAEGMVLSIVNDARTGTTVTMELGDSYQAIYGQLTDLLVSEGDVVEEGAIIGYIAAPTKYYSKEGTNLYFAMKRNGEPIDPILYLP